MSNKKPDFVLMMQHEVEQCPLCERDDASGVLRLTDKLVDGVYDTPRLLWVCDRNPFHQFILGNKGQFVPFTSWQDISRTEEQIEHVYKTRYDCCISGADPHVEIDPSILETGSWPID